MAVSIYQNMLQNRMTFHFHPIGTLELLAFDKAPIDLYTYYEGHFQIFIYENQPIDKNKLKEYIQKKPNNNYLFALGTHFELYQEQLKSILFNVAKSLSIGDPQSKGRKLLLLLLMNLNYLYQDPLNNHLLFGIYQVIIGFSQFLSNNPKLISYFYHLIDKSNYHYTLKQPILSSLMLIGFLKWSKNFSKREIDSLFATSFFKDIGVSLLPHDYLDKKNPSENELNKIHEHPHISYQLLEGRIPLSSNYLNIVANHHFLTNNHIDKEKKSFLLVGMESNLLASFDILAAMLSSRPYRKEIDLFTGLKLLRENTSKEFNQEFKSIVFYLQKFL